jgi:hypothetical protein
MMATTRTPKSSDQYSKKEAAQRFEAVLRGALSTPPKPLKDVPKKRAKPQRKRATKKA